MVAPDTQGHYIFVYEYLENIQYHFQGFTPLRQRSRPQRLSKVNAIQLSFFKNLVSNNNLSMNYLLANQFIACVAQVHGSSNSSLMYRVPAIV